MKKLKNKKLILVKDAGPLYEQSEPVENAAHAVIRWLDEQVV